MNSSQIRKTRSVSVVVKGILSFGFLVNRLRPVFFRTLLVSSLALGGSSLCAQTDSGTINGHVTDPTGAIIPGASVTAIASSTGSKFTGTVDGAGDFSLRSIPAGSYDLTIQAASFAPYKITNIVLNVSQTLVYAAKLTPGGATMEVTVQASSVEVDSQTTTIQQVINQESISQLPLNGRNPAALLFTVSGVSNPLSASATPDGSVISGPQTYPGETVASVHGSRVGGVYFSLDGGNNTDPLQVSGGPFPNPDATGEFAVQTASYGARYVSAPGGAVNILTRSGTNDLHGSVFEFIRNGAVNARNYFSGGSPDILKRNQFGAALGGPIVRNRWFIFGSYQGTRISNQSSTLDFLPTAAQRAGTFTGLVLNPQTFQPFPYNPITNTTQAPASAISAVNQKILALLPVPTTPDGSYTVHNPSKTSENQFVAKTDFTIGSHHFFARYFGDRNGSANIGDPTKSLTGLALGASQQWQSGTVGDTWIHGALVNDFRFTYLFSNSVTAPTPNSPSLKGFGANITQATDPTLAIQLAVGNFAVALNNNASNPRRNLDFSDNLAVAKGKHTMSFGFEVQHINQTTQTDSGQSPLGIYAGIFGLGTPGPTGFTGAGDPRIDFVLGNPVLYIAGDGQYSAITGTLWGVHAEDIYHVNQRTSVTLGLRYDPYFPYTSDNSSVSCFKPGQKSTIYTNAPIGLVYPGDLGCNSSGTGSTLTLVQPRIGVAHQLDSAGKTSIRAAYGIYAQQIPIYALQAFDNAAPFVRTYQLSLPGQIDNPYARFPGGDPFTAGYQLGGALPASNVAFPATPSATSLSQNFQPSYLQQYSVSFQRAITAADLVEIDYVGTKASHLTLNYSLNTPVYNGAASTTANEQARRPFTALGNVYQIQSNGNSNYNGVSITYKHSSRTGLFLTSTFNYSKALDDGSLPGNSLPGTNGNLLPTAAHDFRYGPSDFDQPLTWRNTAVWTSPALKKMNVATRTLLGAWNLNSIFSLESGTPFSVTDGADNSKTGLSADYADRVASQPLYLKNQTRAQYVKQAFNPAAFAPNAIGTFGNAGRNILRSQGYVDFDLGVQKAFPIHDSVNASFRFEAFNVFNRVNLFGPTSSISAGAAFGQITSAKDPRILQASARISF